MIKGILSGVFIMGACLHGVASESMDYCRPEKISTPPVIDGSLDDNCWQKAAEYGPFIENRSQVTPVTQKTSAKVLIDSEYLYVGVYCQEENIAGMKQVYKEDNAPALFSDDCVEIFIAPDYYRQKPYIQYVVNSLGAKFQKLSVDGGWRSDIQTKTKIGGNYWTMEARIKLADLQLTSGELFGMSVCRSRYNGETKEYSVWPVGGGYHAPSGHVLIGQYLPYLAALRTNLDASMKPIRELIGKNAAIKAQFSDKVEAEAAPCYASIDKALSEDSVSPKSFNNCVAQVRTVDERLKVIRLDLEHAAGLSSMTKNNAQFAVRAASSMEKIFRNTFKPEWGKKGTDDKIEIVACGNERESFQAVIIPFADLKNLTWKIDSELALENIKVQPVGYVNVKFNSDHGIIKNYPQSGVVTGDWPDPLYGWSYVPKIENEQIQPIWVTVSIPAGQKPGAYRLNIEFTAENGGSAKLAATVKVLNFSLPDRATLKTDLWWMDSYLQVYYKGIKPDQLSAMSKKFMEAMLDQKITPVDIDPFSKIKISQDAQTGKYSFDFSKTEEILKLVFERSGQKGNVYHATSHHGVGAYTGLKERFQNEAYMTDGHKDFLVQYLQAAKKFHSGKSWEKMTYLNPFDEPDKTWWDRAKWIYPIEKSVAPEWPTIAAMNFMPSVLDLKNVVDVMIPGFFSNFTPENLPVFQQRQKEGRELWGYICFKTACIDFESIDHRMLPWLCWQYELKGFLHWGFMNWSMAGGPVKHPEMYTADPAKRWPNAKWEHMSLEMGVPGDGYWLYPSPEGEPWSSIRLENLRDGIEDHEYLSMLKRTVDSNKDSALLEEGKKLLVESKTFVTSPTSYNRDWRKILEYRAKLGAYLEKALGGMNKEK